MRIDLQGLAVLHDGIIRAHHADCNEWPLDCEESLTLCPVAVSQAFHFQNIIVNS
jgi:hypothetical protein